MTSPTRRSAIGRFLALTGIGLAIALGLLWPRLAWEGRLLLGLTGFLAYGAFLAGTLWPCRGWFAPVVRRFSTAHQEVWLTLDDGPDSRLTPETLNILARHGAKATFFVIGRQAARHPELVRAVTAAGHSVGNHTDTHPSGTFWCRSRRWLARDVDRCTQAIASATGEKPELFRPPVGMVSPAAGSVAEARSLRLIGWSVRGMDARFGSPETIARRILRQVRPGAIILLHPERRPESAAALERVLAGLDERGYRCVIPKTDQFV